MISTRLTTSPNLGTGRKTRAVCQVPQSLSLPERPQASMSALRQTSYVAVVGPNAAWAGEKPRKLARFCRRDAQHDHARRGRRFGHRLDGTARPFAGHAWRGRAKSPAASPCRATMADAEDSSSPMTATRASTWRWPMAACVTCGSAIVRSRTCGRYCKSAAARKR